MQILEILNSFNLSLILLAVCLWIFIQALPRTQILHKTLSSRKKFKAQAPSKVIQELTKISPQNEPTPSSVSSTIFDPQNYVGSYNAQNYIQPLMLKKERQGFDKFLIDNIFLDKDRFIQSHVDKLGVEDFFLIAVSLDTKKRLEFVERLPTMRAVKERILLAAKLKKLQ